jgi:hypothetical protein
VKGLEKLTPIRLAEVLTQKGLVPNEVITDALYAQDRHGEAFAEVLVSTGQISEWDLAKVVVEQFQVPFLMASVYEHQKKAVESLPKELLFRHLIVPLDRFDRIVTVVIPILTPFEVLMRINKEANCEVYPYIGLISENRKVLTERYPEFAAWRDEQEKKRESARKQRAEKPGDPAGDWMNMFDSADQKVRSSLRDGP